MIPGWYNIIVNRSPYPGLRRGSRALLRASIRPPRRYSALLLRTPLRPPHLFTLSVVFELSKFTFIHPFSIQSLTNCSSRNSFVFKTMYFDGGVYLPLSFYPPRTYPHNSFRMNTCKSVSKQRTLSIFRMNTYKKTGGRGHILQAKNIFLLPCSPRPLFHGSRNTGHVTRSLSAGNASCR